MVFPRNLISNSQDSVKTNLRTFIKNAINLLEKEALKSQKKNPINYCISLSIPPGIFVLIFRNLCSSPSYWDPSRHGTRVNLIPFCKNNIHRMSYSNSEVICLQTLENFRCSIFESYLEYSTNLSSLF